MSKRKKVKDEDVDDEQPKKKQKKPTATPVNATSPGEKPWENLVVEDYKQDEIYSSLAVDPENISTREDFSAVFYRVANKLMNETKLYANGTYFRLAELEFYFCGDKHEDIFTHQDELQMSCGQWYFHRAGKKGGYKGGNYKGLDMTFGAPGKGYGGILIRAILNIETNEYLEGPCKCVNKLLELSGTSEIENFVTLEGFSLDVHKKGRLFLQSCSDIEQQTIYSSFRFGLTLKKSDGERSYYIMKPYRFVSHPLLARIGRPHLVLTMHGEGKSAEEIVKITGVGKATVKKYIDTCEGADTKVENFVGKNLSTDDLCQLYKVLDKPH